MIVTSRHEVQPGINEQNYFNMEDPCNKPTG